MKNIITRFAPSPTGLLHIGTYRTAIFAYLFARKNEGKFIVRIEDTDRERSKKEYEENIMESLAWLGMEYDALYRQSENIAKHREYLEKMISSGHAYISKEEAKDGSGVIKEIVRFKNPNKAVSFKDEIKGTVTMDTTDLGDFVIAKNLNEPLFHLAVVVDDFEEGVTHIIRGEDHVSNTPRQILIQEAIGAPTPIYAHLPLVLGPDKLKLSKRRGALPVTAYKERGFLAEAILNGAAFIGWNPGTEQEIFSPHELTEAFDLSHVQKSPAVFNEEKLRWFNKEHIKRLSVELQRQMILSFMSDELKNLKGFEDKFPKLFPLIIERIESFGDVRKMHEEGELSFFFEAPTLNKENLICPEKLRKGMEVGFDIIREHLKETRKNLESLSSFEMEDVKGAVWDYATDKGRGIVLWALRYALSGKEKSPDPFVIASVIGKEETLRRIDNALTLL